MSRVRSWWVPVVVGLAVASSAVALASASAAVHGVFLTGWPFLVCSSIGCLGSAAIGAWLHVRGELGLAWRTWTVSLLFTVLLATGAVAVLVIGVGGDRGMPAAVLNALVAAWRGPVLIGLAVLAIAAARREGAALGRWMIPALWSLGIASGVLTALFYGPGSALASTPAVIDAPWSRSPAAVVVGNALFQACAATLLVVPVALWVLTARASAAARPRLAVVAGSSSLGLLMAALAVIVVMPWQTGVDNAVAASVVFSALGLFTAVLPAGVAAATLPVAERGSTLTATRIVSSSAAAVFGVTLAGSLAALAAVYAPWLTPLGLGLVTVLFAGAALGGILAFVRFTGQPAPDAAEAEASGVLSRREDEVMALVAEGLTNAAVAERLFVSKRTVDAHLRSAFRKLGVADERGANTRVRAVARWSDTKRAPIA